MTARWSRAAAAAIVIAGCGHSQPKDARPLIVVSVPPQAYFVQRLAGDQVRVHVMIPPGASPATFAPSMNELAAISEAALYVKVGHEHFPFERAWLNRLLAQRPGLQVVDAAAGLPHEEHDPHLWVAPRHAQAMTAAIADALTDLLPARAGAIAANRAALDQEIDQVDQDIRELFAGKQGRRFLVFHPAWGYFAEAYGLKQLAIEEHGKQPDAKRLGELIEEARRARLQALFVQPQFDRTSAERIAARVGARVEVIDPLARDWPQNLRHVATLIAGGLSDE